MGITLAFPIVVMPTYITNIKVKLLRAMHIFSDSMAKLWSNFCVYRTFYVIHSHTSQIMTNVTSIQLMILSFVELHRSILNSIPVLMSLIERAVAGGAPDFARTP